MTEEDDLGAGATGPRRDGASDPQPLLLRRGGASEVMFGLGSGAALTDEVELGKGPPIDRLVDALRQVAPEPADPPRVVVHEALNEFTPKRFSIQVYRQAWRPLSASLPVIESSAALDRRRAPRVRLDQRRLVVGKAGVHEMNGRLRAAWSPIGIRVRLSCYELPAERTRIELWPQRRRPVLQWRRYLHAGIAVVDAVVAEIDRSESAVGEALAGAAGGRESDSEACERRACEGVVGEALAGAAGGRESDSEACERRACEAEPSNNVTPSP